MNGIVQGQNWSKQRNFRPPDVLDRRCGEDEEIGSGYEQRSKVMLRKADPVKAQFIGQRCLLKHLLHHSSSEFWLKQAGRRRPACFIHCSDAIGGRWQEGSFHSDSLFQRTTGVEHDPTLLTSLNSLPPAAWEIVCPCSKGTQFAP